ncbi:cytochrome c-type biogenesis protein [Psychrobacter lutiphocae]|uniref:cytochrome c-type biogenesis protein n=1 Tax=Psychrobacter lutiphocae TaxID=540500 RepID=UPI00035F1D3F|nr:cytochrome c-type biogenesis protein [Psychrobacter lutiphocae]
MMTQIYAILKTIKTSVIYVTASLLLCLSLLGLSLPAQAAIEVYEFENPRQEAQYKGLIEEFRCPKCQNQNLAGSDSQIAQDLKRKTYEMVIAGQSDAQIREYMYERYGDFISYKPPVRPSTWILWYFPPVFLLLVVAGWLWRTKSRQRMAVITPDQFLNETDQAKQSKPKVAEIGANLSDEEAAKLKALLKEHGGTEDVDAKVSKSLLKKDD